ncbi:MAG: response regulator [Chitinophagaceae bacterium]
MPTINILIADNHAIVRTGLKYLLEQHFGNYPVDEAYDCPTLMRQLWKKNYTHLILDLQLKNGDVMEILNAVRKTNMTRAIMTYSTSHEIILSTKLFDMGDLVFLNKQSSQNEIITALKLFFSGRK